MTKNNLKNLFFLSFFLLLSGCNDSQNFVNVKSINCTATFTMSFWGKEKTYNVHINKVAESADGSNYVMIDYNPSLVSLKQSTTQPFQWQPIENYENVQCKK